MKFEFTEKKFLTYDRELILLIEPRLFVAVHQ